MDPSSEQLRVEFLSREPLDKDHRLATAWTWPGWPRAGGADGVWTVTRRCAEQLSAEWQQRLAPAVSQKTEEADAHKAMGKHMQQKAA